MALVLMTRVAPPSDMQRSGRDGLTAKDAARQGLDCSSTGMRITRTPDLPQSKETLTWDGTSCSKVEKGVKRRLTAAKAKTIFESGGK